MAAREGSRNLAYWIENAARLYEEPDRPLSDLEVWLRLLEETTEVAQLVGDRSEVLTARPNDVKAFDKASDEMDRAFADIFMWLFAFSGLTRVDLADELTALYADRCPKCKNQAFCVCILEKRSAQHPLVKHAAEIAAAFGRYESLQQTLQRNPESLDDWEQRLSNLYAIQNLVYSEYDILLNLLGHIGDAAKLLRRRSGDWHDDVSKEAAHTFAWAIALYARTHPTGERSVATVILDKYNKFHCYHCGQDRCKCHERLTTSLLLCVAGSKVNVAAHVAHISHLLDDPARRAIVVTPIHLEPTLDRAQLLRRIKETQCVIVVIEQPAGTIEQFTGLLWTLRAAQKSGALLVRRVARTESEVADLISLWSDSTGRFSVDVFADDQQLRAAYLMAILRAIA